jgi:hypothetical protein
MRRAPEVTRGHPAGLGLLVAVAVLGLAFPAVAQIVITPPTVVIAPPPPIVVAAPPPLVVVPTVPTVRYAPALETDVFVYGGRWYYPYHGHWFVGPSYRGPWSPVAFARLPRPVVAVPARYYRVPPGHWKHGGPPGHVKHGGKGGPGDHGHGKGKGH